MPQPLKFLFKKKPTNLKSIDQLFDEQLVSLEEIGIDGRVEEVNVKFKRSIYAIKNIKINEKFNKNNVACFRPNLGLGAENYFTLINKKAKKNIKKNTPIRIGDF